MNKYIELSDFEINKKVAEKLLIPHYVIKDKVLNAGNDSVYDPCNNPSDAMPIIVENGIAIIPFLISTPTAFDSSKGLMLGATAEDDNVLRAAMICFLLMKDAENEG